MRRNAITTAVKEEESEINLTPMLDVVFIMLIFFIVTANFIKEPGLEINRPDSDTAETQEKCCYSYCCWSYWRGLDGWKKNRCKAS